MGWFNWKKANLAAAIYRRSGQWPGWASWKLIMWTKKVLGIG